MALEIGPFFMVRGFMILGVEVINYFPTMVALIFLFVDLSLIYLVKAFVTRKKWGTSNRLDLRTKMMEFTTLFAFFSSIWSFGFDITFKYFLVNSLIESFFSYLTNFFLVILGLSAAEIFYDRKT